MPMSIDWTEIYNKYKGRWIALEAENRLCRKFCSGGHEGAVAHACGGD